MCCSCELCTPNVFVFCSEGHKVWPALTPEKHSRSLQTSSSSLSLPQEPSCPGLHTHTHTHRKSLCYSCEPVFDDSPPAERIGWEGSTNSPYLTATLNKGFIKEVSSRVFLDLLVWIKVPRGRPSTPLRFFCSYSDIFSQSSSSGVKFSCSLFLFFFDLVPSSAPSGCNKARIPSLLCFFFPS